VIYRLRAWIEVPAWQGTPFILAVLLAAALAFPSTLVSNRPLWWDLICVLFLMPIIVAVGTGQQRVDRLGILLGRLSYPIYVLHFPVLLIASGLHQTRLSQVNVHLLAAASTASVLALAYLALRFYDEPVRRTLNGALVGVRVSRPHGRGHAPVERLLGAPGKTGPSST